MTEAAAKTLPDPWTLALLAWGFSLVATLGSLRYSGIGFLGIAGVGLVPCELCWYQRILMYPLTALLAVAWWKRDLVMAKTGLGLAGLGALVAAYHSLIQYLPHLERGQCLPGASCTAVLYRVLGLSIPNQSLLAFLAITALLGALVWAARAGQRAGHDA